MVLDRYESPLGIMVLTADAEGLTSLWFEEGRDAASPAIAADAQAADAADADTAARGHLDAAARWLDVYFSGREPDFVPRVHLAGTAFQREVWDALREIPYGHTTTYGALARVVARRLGVERMAAQAIGGAVGRNPVSLIVPCHRVVGAGGKLTGYAGGLDRKRALLELEGAAQ